MSLLRRLVVLATFISLCLSAPAIASDLLVNGHFDGVPFATGWVQDDAGSGYPPIVHGSEMPPTVPPQSAPNAAWLGGIPSVTLRIYQDVAVPVGTTRVTLGGYVAILTEEFGPFDHLYAEILTPAGVPLELLRHWTPFDAGASWAPFSLLATGNYAGQTIRLQFRSTTDASQNTSFFLDTIELDATTAVDVTSALPKTTGLSAARPNPTRGVARLRLDLPASAPVHAAIYDLQGRRVRRLLDGRLEAGSHDLAWDGTDAAGAPAGSGVYVCRADVGGRVLVQRIALTR